MGKLSELELLNSVINWIIGIRLQRIKLTDAWMFLRLGPCSLRSSTRNKVGSLVVLVLINNLVIHDELNAELRKYVDDTTTKL